MAATHLPSARHISRRFILWTSHAILIISVTSVPLTTAPDAGSLGAEWSSWTKCSVTTGEGVMHRYRADDGQSVRDVMKCFVEPCECPTSGENNYFFLLREKLMGVGFELGLVFRCRNRNWTSAGSTHTDWRTGSDDGTGDRGSNPRYAQPASLAADVHTIYLPTLRPPLPPLPSISAPLPPPPPPPPQKYVAVRETDDGITCVHYIITTLLLCTTQFVYERQTTTLWIKSRAESVLHRRLHIALFISK